MRPFVKKVSIYNEYRSVVAFLSWIAGYGRLGNYYRLELYTGLAGNLPITIYKGLSKPMFRSLILLQILWLIPYLILQLIMIIVYILYIVFLFFVECLFKQSFISNGDYVTIGSGYFCLGLAVYGLFNIIKLFF